MFWFLFLLAVALLIAWLAPVYLVAKLAGPESGSFGERFFKALGWWPIGLIRFIVFLIFFEDRPWE